MKSLKKLLLVLAGLLILMSGCNQEESREKYSYRFYDAFDTVFDLTVYSKDQAEADKYFDFMEERFMELDKLYTRFDSYEAINNVATINDQAGKNPVQVEKDLYDLIDLSIKYYNDYSQMTDISLGSLIDVWHKYQDLNIELMTSDREDIYSKEERLPSEEELRESMENTGMDHIILNEEDQSVFIDDPNVQMDLGSVAKGYAVELVAQEVEELGCDSGLISGGGNVRTIGKPMDGQREKWGVGIWNPEEAEADPNQSNILETVYVGQTSVVTSGDYQRFFLVDDEKYHHIIDKTTMKPARHYRSVTIVHDDSGLADFLSTATFVLPNEESKALIESIDGAEAMWVFDDLTIEYTEGFKEISKSFGASND